MRLPGQIIWPARALLAGGAFPWLLLPPQRRHFIGLIIGGIVLLVLGFGLGCRRGPQTEAKIHADRFKDKYFVRCLTYNMEGDHLLISDDRSPRIITVDPWLEVIFAGADGQRTVQEFVEQLGREYPGGAPASLTEQTYRLVAKMEAEGLIRFTDTKTQLSYYLSMPSSQQDRQRALAEMKKDGFIK
jgi:hypothetical protein